MALALRMLRSDRRAAAALGSRARPHHCSFSTSLWFGASRQDRRNLYQILGVSTSATREEIKKKFYALSLAHHPDKNRYKPNSSTEYSSISNAYNTLSDDTARAQYDRTHNITREPTAAKVHAAGRSSWSHVGSRPASGLSKRTSPFRGPPPSFYTHGRYGSSGRTTPTPPPNASGRVGKQPQPTEPDPAWFVDDNQVPHFDAKAHLSTQKKQDERRRQRRAASLKSEQRRRADVADSDVGGTETTRFFLLAAVVGVAAAATLGLGGETAKKRRRTRAEVAQRPEDAASAPETQPR